MSFFKKISITLIFLAIILYLRHLTHFDFKGGMIPQDFSVYLKPSKLISEGRSPYDPSDYLTYKYSPGLIPFFSLLPSNPIHAWLVAKAGYLFLFALGTILFLKLHLAKITAPSLKSVAPLFLGLLLGWKGIIEGLDFGQTEYLLLGILGLGVYLGTSSQLYLGIAIGTLPFIKLPWGLLSVPFFMTLAALERAQFRSGVKGFFMAVFFMALFLPIWSFGWTHTLQYYQDWFLVLKTQPTYMFDFENANQSIWASFVRWFGIQNKIAGWILMGPLIALVYLKSQAELAIPGLKYQESLGWWSRWLALILLLNPLSWRWAGLLIVGLPFSWHYAHLWSQNNGKMTIQTSEVLPLKERALIGFCSLMVFVMFLFQQNPIVKILKFNHWTRLHDFGLITVFWIVMLILSLIPFEVNKTRTR